MTIAELAAAELAAYNEARRAQQEAISMLDSMGRRPTSKTRRASYDAAVERELAAKAAWDIADRALSAAKRLG